MINLNELETLAKAADGRAGIAFGKEIAQFQVAANPETILALTSLLREMAQVLEMVDAVVVTPCIAGVSEALAKYREMV